MKKRSLKKLAAGVLSAAMILGTMTGSMAVSAEENNGMVRSFLTGKLVPETIGRRKAISVMINNIQNALPQSGIANAEVVYEAPVEGGITRLMGIFEDYQDVERIGSVRSCREYYIYFAREFNTIYCHFGQAVYAIPLLQLQNTLNISGLAEPQTGVCEAAYYRGDDFPAPHNVFTNYDMIQSAMDYLGYSTEYSSEYQATGHYKFAADDAPVTLDNGVDAGVVSPGYEYNHPYFEYNPETGKYTRYQYGDVQIDRNTGNPLKYDNIIFQYCSWEKLDDNGYLGINTYAGGSGKYITRGKAIDITWKKDNPNLEDPYAESNFDVTHYYDADGNEITLNQGKTWVCILLDSSSDAVKICPDMASYTAN